MNCECEVLHMRILDIVHDSLQQVIGCVNNAMTRERIINYCCMKLEQLRCETYLII